MVKLLLHKIWGFVVLFYRHSRGVMHFGGCIYTAVSGQDLPQRGSPAPSAVSPRDWAPCHRVRNNLHHLTASHCCHVWTSLCSIAALNWMFERSCLPQECCCVCALAIRKAVAWKMQVQQLNTHTFQCTNWYLCCQSWEQPSQRDFVMKKDRKSVV